MSGDINTKITGNPADLRLTANWLRSSLGREVQEAAQALTSARATAEAGWDGAAGDAFSAKMLAAAKQGHELAGLIGFAATKFDELAQLLQNAQSFMHDLRTAAAGSGLSVIGDIIKDPTGTRDAATKAAAYEAAQTKAAAGRLLAKKYDDTSQEVKNEIRKKWGFVIADLVAGNTHAVVAARASALTRRAEGMARVAQQMDTARASFAPGTGYMQTRDLRYAARDLNRSAAATNTAAAKWGTAAKWTGKAVYPLAIASVAYDISYQGKDPSKAITSGVAGLAAGAAAGALGGAATGALVGTVFPGPGNIIGGVAGAAIGTTTGLLTSGLVDSMWDDEDKRMTNAIGDGLNATGTAIGTISKRAWSAIF